MRSNLGRRLIGNSARFSADGEVVGIDVPGLVRRLLLFDQYVLFSVRLEEFPYLASELGFEGLRSLLEARILEVRCECVQIAQVGQSGFFGDRILPHFSYKFNWIDSHDRKKYISGCLKGMNEVPSFRLKEIMVLKRLIVDSIKPLTQAVRLNFWPSVRSDLLNSQYVKEAVTFLLDHQFGITAREFELRVIEDDDTQFRVEHSLASSTTLAPEKIHRLIESALLGISSVAQSILEMDFYSALSGFNAADLPLFQSKLKGLARQVSTEANESAFTRVIELAGIGIGADQRLDVEKLLEVRQSSEARQFRDWLQSCGTAEDRELLERVKSFRARIGLFASSGTGKGLRFLLSSGIGLVHGLPPAVGVGVSVVDAFVIDKIFPRCGIAAFVNESYPSIFEK